MGRPYYYPEYCDQCDSRLRQETKCGQGCTGRVDDETTELIGSLYRLGKKFPGQRTSEQLAIEAATSMFPETILFETFKEGYIFDITGMTDYGKNDVFLIVRESGDVYARIESVIERNAHIDNVDYRKVDLSMKTEQVKSKVIQRAHLRLVQ